MYKSGKTGNNLYILKVEVYINMEDMRNIVVLKDLPSNLVEEAIIVLKQNQKIKKPEYVENKGKTEQKSEKHKFGNYITKEAEMLITDYITKVEKNKKNKEIKKIENKYKTLKRINIGLSIILFISLLFNLI